MTLFLQVIYMYISLKKIAKSIVAVSYPEFQNI